MLNKMKKLNIFLCEQLQMTWCLCRFKLIQHHNPSVFTDNYKHEIPSNDLPIYG